MKYSIIIPVYNRPDELDELLASLTRQTVRDFEVIVVDDGSATPCGNIAEKYADKLVIKYFYKQNSGPGQSRNYGADRAQGEWLIILDSDTIIPEGYLAAIEKGLSEASECGAVTGREVVTKTDAFGGPDREHDSFSDIQKAISYSMTSFFTTGGIRGGKRKLDKFYPRSFNMGIRRSVFMALGGFSKMRFGEDIDLSIRIFEAGYKARLFTDAWVWHKRRTDFRKFYRQVYNSGIARINLSLRHPGTLKLVHLLPAAFTIFEGICIISLILWLIAVWTAPSSVFLLVSMRTFQFTALCLFLYALLIFLDAGRRLNTKTSALSVAASFIQLTGYGTGFLHAFWNRIILRKPEFEAFRKNFYK